MCPESQPSKASRADPYTFGGTSWATPLIKSPSISHWVSAAARRYADGTCLIEIGPDGAQTARLTYRELAFAVTERAAWLRGQLPPDADYVGLSIENSSESVLNLLGVLEIGAAAVVVDSDEADGRRDEQFARLCAAVVDRTGAQARVTRRSPVRPPAPAAGPHPIAFVLYTTGSTAAAKPVAQSHYAVLTNVLATIRRLQLQPGQTTACALPLSHVNGLHFGLLASLLSGGTCLLFRRFEPLAYLRALSGYRVTRATTVPSLLGVLSELRRWPALPDLRYFVSAAAPLSTRTASAVFSHGGHQVVQGYGLSECMNFASIMPPDLAGNAYERIVLGGAVPPVGHAVHGCEIAVLDAAGRPVPDGTVGEVGVRGHSLMSGYLGDDTASRLALRDGWLHTGDLGRLGSPDGSGRTWLTLVGRAKNVAKCGGVSVSLEELDHWISGLDGVREVVCVTRPDPRRGDAVTAYYVPQSGTRFMPADVTAHVSCRFDTGRLGLLAVQTSALPRLRSGKVDRRALMELRQDPLRG